MIVLMGTAVMIVLVEIGEGGESKTWRLLNVTFDGVIESWVSFVVSFMIGTLWFPLICTLLGLIKGVDHRLLWVFLNN